MKKYTKPAVVAGLLLLCAPVLSSAQELQKRDAAVRDARPAPDVTDVDASLRARFAGHYAFSVVDTNAPAGTYTAGVGRIKVNRDGIFVMTLFNPEYQATATLTGVVTPRGKLVFVPSLGNNIRTNIRIRARGRIVTGLYGQYKVALAPIVDPAAEEIPDPDNVLTPADLAAERTGNAADVVDVDPITNAPVAKRAGVVIGFRASTLRPALSADE